MKIRFAANTNVGYLRSENQDNFFLNGEYKETPNEKNMTLKGTSLNDSVFLSVCDGMGGTDKGEIASWLICRSLSRMTDFSFFDRRYTLIIKAINQTVWNYAEVNRLNVCGSTFTAALFKDSSLYVYNIGDSPAFLFRNNMINKLTRDDTLYERYRILGVDVPRGKNALVSYIGMNPQKYDIKAHRAIVHNIRPGDILFMCTDGVVNSVSEEYIKDILKSDLKPQGKAKLIIDECLYNKCHDNVTVLIAEFTEN